MSRGTSADYQEKAAQMLRMAATTSGAVRRAYIDVSMAYAELAGACAWVEGGAFLKDRPGLPQSKT